MSSSTIHFEPSSAPRAGRRARRGGELDMQLEEDLDSGSRTFAVRLYYEWDGYDPCAGRAPWGARIVGLDVLGVECDGDATISRDAAQLAAAAWNLVEQDFEALEDRCTRHGMECGIGTAEPLAMLRTARDESPHCVMAPSTRSSAQKPLRHRKWG